MLYKYFRFYPISKENEDFYAYKALLKKSKGLGFVRASFDLTSREKSISILCKSDKKIRNERKDWAEYLAKNKILISGKIEHGMLKQEDGPVASCLHGNNCNHASIDHDKHTHDKHDHHQNHWLKAALGLIYGLGLMILSFASFNIPMIAYYILNAASVLLTCYLGQKLYVSAWHALKQKKLNMAILYTISTLTILGISILGLIVPDVTMMLESAPLILGFWHLGEAIEHTLLDKINEKLDVRDCAPKSVLLKGNPNKKISVKKLIPNDIIIVNKGEVIPIDGILKKSAVLYTTKVNGSPFPKQFKAGDAVKAGMRLANPLSTLEMRVTKTYQNSYLSLIANNINKANQKKAPVEVFANKILKYFVPGLLGVATISGIVIGALFTPLLAIQCVISILVSACPCALSLITPMAVRIGMKKASDKGVHYKNGKALQAAADINTVVFDLNGTLTQGEASVRKLIIQDRRLLKYIASLERHSDHPASKAINRYIAQQNISLDKSLRVSNLDKRHHGGIKGNINGQTFIVGNKEMLRANGITDIDAKFNDVKNGTIYMVHNSKVIGQLALTDRLRDDAIATVNQLKRMGKQVHICTGADTSTAQQYAKLLGIPLENICANAVGAATNAAEVSKKSYIKRLQQRGFKVAMVGDAANDLTAIASADIGIAVKSSIGDTLTEQQAGMVVQKGLLFSIASAFDVAAMTKRNIFQNLFVSLTYNSIVTLVASGVFIAMGLTLNPAIGVLLMALESGVVLANLYGFKQQETVIAAAEKQVASLPKTIFSPLQIGLFATAAIALVCSTVGWALGYSLLVGTCIGVLSEVRKRFYQRCHQTVKVNPSQQLTSSEQYYFQQGCAARQSYADYTNSFIDLGAWKHYRVYGAGLLIERPEQEGFDQGARFKINRRLSR